MLHCPHIVSPLLGADAVLAPRGAVCSHCPHHSLLGTLVREVSEVDCLSPVAHLHNTFLPTLEGKKCCLKKCVAWVCTHSHHQMDMPVWGTMRNASTCALSQCLICLVVVRLSHVSHLWHAATPSPLQSTLTHPQPLSDPLTCPQASYRQS